MPEIRIELTPDELGKLDTEVDLLGFADREAYLHWIIGNRAAIEQGTERDQLLTEYQSRVDELEDQLASQDASDAGANSDADASAEGGADATATADGESDATASATADGAASATADGNRGAGAGGDADGERPRAADGSGTMGRPTGASLANDADATGSGSGASGTQSTLSSTERTERAGESDRADAASDEVAAEAMDANAPTADAADVDAAAAETAAREDLGGNFRPERVERFEDESLGSQADQLKGVEGERLDEFARRAVAKTRERLGREPSTGLDYRSGTRISRSSSDVRPGEDLVNLDELDVPGRSEETCAPRREAVGAALAYLRDVERAKRSDFVGELYDEYPAGYDTESSWWRCIKRGLKDARVADGGDGSRVWTYDPPGSTEGQLVGSGPKRIVDPD